MNCRVEAFGKCVEGFDEQKWRLVREMGFGGLLFLEGLRLPRTFYYWLCSRVDVSSKTWLGPGGIEISLSKAQVYWIFGIPIGEKVLPLFEEDEENGYFK